jgi:hypothetical protein
MGILSALAIIYHLIRIKSQENTNKFELKLVLVIGINFRKNLKKFGQNSDITIFKDVKIRGRLSRAYFCEETSRVVGILTEGPDAGRIIKAQPLDDLQINILRTQNRLN